MARMLKKNKTEILREALAKLEGMTPVKSTGPGSVARAFTEAISVELGDAYDAFDYSLNQSLLSTASGASLDMIGGMYNVRRKTVSELASVDKKVGAFYFYLDSPAGSDVNIPIGTKVYTQVDTFIGRQLSYETTAPTVIRAGRVRAWTSLKPSFSTAEYTAAANTLTIHDCPNPLGVVIRCTNPKSIAPQLGLEDDDNYRVRIQKQIRVASSGTLEAVRFAGLSAQGVRDIRIRQRVYGMGVFEAMIVPEEANLGQAAYSDAATLMSNVAPVGVRMWVTRPVFRPMDISASLVLDTRQDNIEQVTRQVRVALMRYLNTLLPGDPVVYNRVISAIMDVSPVIQDVMVTRWAPNGVESVRRNYTPQDDEMVIPGNLTIDIAI